MEIYGAWIGSCQNPSAVEYVLCMDERWGFTKGDVTDIWGWSRMRLDKQDKVVWNEGRRCYVDGVNTAAQASTGIILIVNADDQYPCQNWDVELIKLVPQCTDFAISVSTGTPDEHKRGIMVAPILSRPYYEKKGHVFYPAYESMYADNDFYECAVEDKVLVDGRHLLFPHRHPLVDRTIAVDDQYLEMNRSEAYRVGEQIIQSRRESKFGKRVVRANKPIVMEAPSAASVEHSAPTRTVAVGLPGEHFSSAWVSMWTELYIHLIGGFNVQPLFCYSTNVYVTRYAIHNHFASQRPQPDFVLWIDDDNLLAPLQFDMLMADLDAHPGVDMVCGWCWIATDVIETEPKTSVGHLETIGMPRHISYTELMSGDEPLRQIDFTGFPVVLMRGSVLDKLGSNPFAPVFSPAYPQGFTGEDTAFCIRAKEAGLTILVDRRVKVPHLKLRSAEPKDLPDVAVTEVA